VIAVTERLTGGGGGGRRATRTLKNNRAPLTHPTGCCCTRALHGITDAWQTLVVPLVSILLAASFEPIPLI